jgi:hypothetical protein
VEEKWWRVDWEMVAWWEELVGKSAQPGMAVPQVRDDSKCQLIEWWEEIRVMIRNL